MQATKLGWRKLQQSYELEIAHYQSKHPDNPDGWEDNQREAISFEKEAEEPVAS